MDFVGSPTALRRWSMASLIGNMAIIVTGGLVRVTGSGLGCSTWPACLPGSYVPHAESGAHAFIEFGNRMLTFVLVVIALCTFVAAWKARDDAGQPRRRVRGLAIAAAAGIPAQAVIGGISVLSGLNPWVVGLHLLPSVALIVICMVLVHEAWEKESAPADGRTRLLARSVAATGILVVLLGMVVTGAGPNSGDGGASRNGLEVAAVARLHSLAVWLVLILTALVLWTARGALRKAAWLVLAAELLQGVIGYSQFLLGLPPALVAAHMAGTALFTAAGANLWWLARPEEPAQKISGSIAAATKTIAR